MSELKLYSLGIVIEDKPVGSDFVMVSPVEVLNIQQSGLIKEQKTIYEGTHKKADGTGFSTEMKSKNYLKAKWLPLGHSNRLTAPDLVKNETILLFKFGDVDEYYWTTIFREVELRRQETVLYGFSNLKSGIVAFDKSTSYWMEVDTRKKTVKFHTAMNDGEFTEYDIIFNTKEGTVLFTDKRGNYVYLDSPKDTITVNMLKDIVGIAGQDINVKAGRDIIAKAEKNIEATAGTNIKAKAGNNITAEAGTSINIKAPSIYINGNVYVTGNISTIGHNNSTGTINIDGNIEHRGNTQHNGNTQQSGDIKQKGNTNQTGNVDISGDVNVSGSILDTNGNSNHHHHAD